MNPVDYEAWSNVFKEGMGKTKGARGESALQVYRTEWLTKPTNQFGSMLEANRGAAILTTAFAESRLAHGTHVPTITDTPTYLLQGKNLDMGGKAARDFIIARINIDNAEKQSSRKHRQGDCRQDSGAIGNHRSGQS